MSGRLIFLATIVIGYLTTGITGNGHLTRPSATNVSFTRDGCGTTKLCVGDNNCDPAGNVLCSFASARLVNATAPDVAFELYGNSSGYIALVLTTDVNQGGSLLFVCSRDPFNMSRNFIFRTASQANSSSNITLTNSPNVDTITYNFNGSINGSFHQCTFIARQLSTSTLNNRQGNLNFQVSIVNGEVGADGSFQTPSVLFRSNGLLDLSSPTGVTAATASPNTTMSATTQAPTTMSGSSSLMHPLTQATAILVSALMLRLL